MNYREKIRKAIECPQFGNEHYGEWGALTLEQRKYIKRLLDELDNTDNYCKKVYLENQKQKEFIKYMNDIIEDLETEDVDDEEMKAYLIQRIDTFKEILQKYKDIIGYDK